MEYRHEVYRQLLSRRTFREDSAALQGLSDELEIKQAELEAVPS